MSQVPQGRSGRSPASPKQISDQLLRLLVVAENLRSHALDAGQVLDYLRVLALSSVGKRSLNVNLAAAAEAARVAGYIAKYATKSTQDAGGGAHRIEHAHELSGLRCREHARRLITSAWQAGAREEIDTKRARRWAHQFGFGGHCFTKSRRFSTTFKALREARAAHAADRATGSGEASAKSDHNLIHVSAWSYTGSGYPEAGDALLADSSHARAREHRRLAREAPMDEASEGNQGHREAV
ncbi:MAG: replication initiator [Jiangellaceae bacterium]